MRYRCSNCTDLFVVSDSTSLYPQSFCSKGCEVKAVVSRYTGDSFSSTLEALALDTRVFQEVH